MKVFCFILDLFSSLVLALSFWIFSISKIAGFTVAEGLLLYLYILWCKDSVKHYFRRKELNKNGFE